MADKLDWLNKHMVLLRYVSLADVVEKEGYKIRPDLAELFVGMTGAEDMVFKFAKEERYKCASELMAHIAHRRAAIWWGYRCVQSLAEELCLNPPEDEDEDLDDMTDDMESEIPEWANVEAPEPSPEVLAEMEAQLAEMKANHAKARAAVDQELLKFAEDALEVAYQEFKAKHGIHPIELLEKLGERLKEDPFEVDPDSPIFTESAKLEAELKAEEMEILEEVKGIIPPENPEHEKKLQDASMDAVFRWIAAPNAENSHKCLAAGNEDSESPAGLLSLSAFWAFGDLLPMGEQTVPTPPGLAANGLCQVFLLCATHDGGTRKLKERYEEYFRLGVEVLTGADNWEPCLAMGKPPHREETPIDLAAPPQPVEPPVPSVASNEETPPLGDAAPPENDPVYKRWKPGGLT